MKVSTRLSLAEYSLYSGFVVLTLLQVLSLERVTGPLSQALRLSRLKEADLEDQVCGQDLILFNYVICVSTVWKTPKKTLFYFRCVPLL